MSRTPHVPDTVSPPSHLQDGSRLPADLLSAYAFTGVRVLAAAFITGLLYRESAPAAAVFVVGRSMLSVLSYVFAGFNPVVQHYMWIAETSEAELSSPADITQPSRTLEYESRPRRRSLPASFVSGQAVALAVFLFSLIAGAVYGAFFVSLHGLAGVSPLEGRDLIAPLVWGFALRLSCEPAGALLQQSRRLWLDNVIQIIGELLWVGLIVLDTNSTKSLARQVGDACAFSGALVFALRLLAAVSFGRRTESEARLFRFSLMRRIAAACALVSLGHVADFLYAPFNLLLIGRALSPTEVLAYGPLLQIDSALLLLVTALANVVLPRAIMSAGRSDHLALRRLYVRASLASVLLLLSGALTIYTLREIILTRWLGTVPAQSLHILPFVLIHTVIGGTAGVGRAVLLGMGHFKAYTLSALLGGIANVALALIFALVLNLGLIGIVLATVISVTARCAIWMPWYILRVLRQGSTGTKP